MQVWITANESVNQQKSSSNKAQDQMLIQDAYIDLTFMFHEQN